MSQLLNRNKITIELMPNNYYIQLPKSQRDAATLRQVELAPLQIKKVEIFKSYSRHVTDVIVEIDNLDPNIAVLWSEGKYIARLMISAENVEDDNRALENYFACYNMEIREMPKQFAVHGSAPVVAATVILKSITRTRLEAENNFTFELGGKNGKGAAGMGQAPIQFLNSDLMKMYVRNYMEEGDTARIPWDMTFTDLIEPVHQIHTSPSNGYKIITNTNMQALEFFFKHYPIFNTPYDWILDDFDTKGGEPTKLKISDFTWWMAWEQHINVGLSKVINRELKEGTTPSTKEYRTAMTFSFFDVQQLEHMSYYDWVVFYVKHGYPKIWAVDVSSGKPIPMVSWNAIHEEAPVLTPSGLIKVIPNPSYEEYLTFMTPKEIEESQQWLNIFQGLHPTLQKYTFSNVFIGDIDLHTIVEFKLDIMKDTGKYDRLGMGYQVLHTYTREDLQPATFTEISAGGNNSDPNNSAFTFSYALTSEVVFLIIDKGPLELESVGNEDAVNVSAAYGDYKFEQYDPCAAASDVNGGPGGETGTDGSNIPGNNSIYEQAMSMYNRGFKYVYGGKKNLDVGVDCSGFTSLAVIRSGRTGYLRGNAHMQRNWCRKYGKKIAKTANALPGDVVFFRWNGYGSFGHTGIAISSTEYVHSSGGSKNTIRNKGLGADINPMSRYGPNVIEIYRLPS